MATAIMKCQQCNLVGDSVSRCGSPLTCPGEAGQVAVDLTKELVIGCTHCTITTSVVIGRVMQGKGVDRRPCLREVSTCEAKVVDFTPKATGKAKAPVVITPPAGVEDAQGE